MRGHFTSNRAASGITYEQTYTSRTQLLIGEGIMGVVRVVTPYIQQRYTTNALCASAPTPALGEKRLFYPRQQWEMSPNPQAFFISYLLPIL